MTILLLVPVRELRQRLRSTLAAHRVTVHSSSGMAEAAKLITSSIPYDAVIVCDDEMLLPADAITRLRSLVQDAPIMTLTLRGGLQLEAITGRSCHTGTARDTAEKIERLLSGSL